MGLNKARFLKDRSPFLSTPVGDPTTRPLCPGDVRGTGVVRLSLSYRTSAANSSLPVGRFPLVEPLGKRVGQLANCASHSVRTRWYVSAGLRGADRAYGLLAGGCDGCPHWRLRSRQGRGGSYCDKEPSTDTSYADEPENSPPNSGIPNRPEHFHPLLDHNFLESFVIHHAARWRVREATGFRVLTSARMPRQ